MIISISNDYSSYSIDLSMFAGMGEITEIRIDTETRDVEVITVAKNTAREIISKSILKSKNIKSIS